MRIFLILPVLVIACAPRTKSECSEKTPCDFGAVCVENLCVVQSCSTSDQCGIEQYCSADRTCAEGCELDTDCKFGDTCDPNSHACAPQTCTDGRLDCGFGEFCSPSGECYEAGGYFCQECNDVGDCGGNGNLCYGGFCAPTCVDATDCPNGFQCYPFTDNGVVVSHQCYTDCSLYGK